MRLWFELHVPEGRLEPALPEARPVIDEMARILYEAGATPLSAVRAAIALEDGCAVRDAYELIEIRPDPAAFEAQLLAAEIVRSRELSLVGSGT